MNHCLLLLGCLLAARAAAADDLQDEVRRLVRGLDSPRLAEREAAEAELLRRGPAALELLPSADEIDSAEVQERLGRVRRRLQQAASEAFAHSSLITLHADAIPLQKMLAALQEQSGNVVADCRPQFGRSADGDPTLALHFDKTPFWPALDQVLDQAGLTAYAYAGRRAVCLVAASNGKRVGRACYSGPFRIEPLSIVARRDLNRPDAGTLAVALEIAWEPRLRIIRLVQPMADVQATDDRGESLPVADAEAQLETAGGVNSAASWTLPLRLPPRGVRQIARLNGRLHATIAGRVETFRFPNLTDLKNARQRIAGAAVALERVRRSAGTLEIVVRIRFDDAGDALASHRQWIADNEAYLEGADGKPIAHSGFETIAQGNNEIAATYRFNTEKPPAEFAFVYKMPATIITRSFDYALKEIKLP